MTLIELVYDVRHILKQVQDDSSIPDKFIAQLVAKYRAIEIVMDFEKFGEINPVWIQPLGVYNTTKVNASDKQVNAGTICFGKVTLPPVIKFDNDLGVYRIALSGNQSRIYPLSQDLMMLKIEGNEISNGFYFYYKIFNNYFVYPFVSSIFPNLILEDPMDGYLLTTENVITGNIVTDDSYTVGTGNIIYNSTVYNAGDIFTGLSGITTFSGGGTVKYTNNKRRLRMSDEYPIDIAMAGKVILNILTKEFNLQQQQVSDIVNDAADQTKVLSQYGARGSKQ